MPSTNPATTTNMTTSNPPDKSTMESLGRWKQRSQETHEKIHIPELLALTSPINILLIGDSFIERFKEQPTCTRMHTTTTTTTISSTSTSSSTNTDTKNPITTVVFNAGVGGDRIQNILYRLTTLNLLSHLTTQKVTDHIIIRMGTNNLKSKKPVPQEDYDAYRAVVALLMNAFPNTKVLVTGLTHRTDIPEGFVDEFNWRLEGMVEELNYYDDKEGGKKGRVRYLAAPREIVFERHLVDHVHLNDEGYRIWYSQLVEYLDGGVV